MFGECYITGQWGRVQNKKCYSMFSSTFLAFFFFFSVIKFVLKISFYREVLNFRNRYQNLLVFP